MENRRTYVTSMPKNCKECGEFSCDKEGCAFCLCNGEIVNLENNKRDDNCPLILVKESES